MDRQRLAHLQEFYNLLGRLEEVNGGARMLAGCTGRQEWPRRGVYFFTEPGEDRSHTGSGSRVVRVGTHALKAGSSASLWTRLSQHRGQAKSGGGNHRGSIFRLIVGTALIARDGHACGSWDDRRSTAPPGVRTGEGTLEQEVSKTIGAMRFLWLAVDDDPGPESARGVIERNAIALISNFGKEAIDAPSPRWLGQYCNRGRVRLSGLWNNNHVDETYDAAFLGRMANLIDAAQAQR